MSRTKRKYFAHFGPSIDVVPVTQFGTLRLSEEQWAAAWRLCGPSAARNMTGGSKRPPLQLWQVIAAAYLEGLNHGAGISADRDT